MADETIYKDKLVAWDGAYPDADAADTWAVEIKAEDDRRMIRLDIVDPDGKSQVVILEVAGREIGIRAYPGDRDEPLVVVKIGQDRAVVHRNVAEPDGLDYVVVDDDGMRFVGTPEPTQTVPKIG